MIEKLSAGLRPMSNARLSAISVQDNVPAFDSSEAVAIVERSLGGKLSDKFESFDMEPIAAASLGQVHCLLGFGKLNIRIILSQE